MTYPALPDAQVVVAEIIDDGSTPVRKRVPDPRPAEFYRLVRTGGVSANRIVDEAQIAVESWANDEDRAMELAQQARAALHNARGLAWADAIVSHVGELAGPSQLPDPESGQQRVTQTFTVHVRTAPGS